MHTLDTLECTHLFARYEHDGMSGSTSTTSTTDTMDVAFWIMRNMVVHDEIDIVHIESTRGDISTDEYTHMSFLEVLQGSHTISLLHISVDICSWESIAVEIAFELFGFMLLRGKYHDLILRKAFEDTLQYWVFVPDTDTHEDMIDRINGRSFRKDERLDFTLNMRIKHTGDLLSICSWKCDDLLEWLHRFPDLCHCRSKSHIHHLIDLIEDECRDRIQIDPSTLHKIHETSWSGDDDLSACAECLLLLPDRRSTIDGERSHTHMAREIEYFITSLASELTSRL